MNGVLIKRELLIHRKLEIQTAREKIQERTTLTAQLAACIIRVLELTQQTLHQGGDVLRNDAAACGEASSEKYSRSNKRTIRRVRLGTCDAASKTGGGGTLLHPHMAAACSTSRLLLSVSRRYSRRIILGQNTPELTASSLNVCREGEGVYILT